MTKKITIGISFPDPNVLDMAKARAEELGIRSFSEYINQLIKYDLGLPNYISAYMAEKRLNAAEKLISELPAHNKKS